MQKLKVLIVDDELGIREGTRRVLEDFVFSLSYVGEEYGFLLFTAASGEEALALMREREFDIVLLDNKLPGIQGADILEFLQMEKRDTLALMMTAYASVETAVAATKRGAYDFIVKPFTPDEMKSALHKAGKHLILARLASKLTAEKNKIRFELISLVAHELKAPIDAVTGYLRLMNEKTAGAKIEDYQHMIERSLARMEGMKKLIFDLLDLTRIESGATRRSLKQVDLKEAARMAIENMRNKAGEKRVKIELNAPGLFYFRADWMEMEMLFNNLVSNAVKYNIEQGKVDVSLEDIDDSTVIKVRDTGIGMTGDETKIIFNEFTRIKNEKTHHIPGSGMGLSIVKKIVDLYNGSIKAESFTGEGTVFTVILPKERMESTGDKNEPHFGKNN
ncbi:MAG: ATP-binding protein [Clostridiales bacterium]